MVLFYSIQFSNYSQSICCAQDSLCHVTSSKAGHCSRGCCRSTENADNQEMGPDVRKPVKSRSTGHWGSSRRGTNSILGEKHISYDFTSSQDVKEEHTVWIIESGVKASCLGKANENMHIFPFGFVHVHNVFFQVPPLISSWACDSS